MNAHTTETPIGPPTLPAELEQLEARVQSRLHGRVRDFRVVVRGGGVMLTGHAHTYYAKQLAQHAVMEATTLPIVANAIDVD